MNEENQLQLQSFLDGELPPEEARTVAGLIQRDPAAAGLLAELKHTRQILRQKESPVTIPVSREFYWSRIKQDIARWDDRAPSRPASRGLLAKLRFLVLPAAAAMVLIIVGLAIHYHAAPSATAKATGGDSPPADTALATTATNGSLTR